MRIPAVVFTLALFVSLPCSGAAESADPITGIGPVGEIVQLHTGFRFTEGPATDKAGNLYFTDVPAGLIYKSDLDGKLTKVVEKSMGCNGLMFDATGRLLACQGGLGRIVAVDTESGKLTPVAKGYKSNRFIRPNDLVVDTHGGIYFTDPVFGRGDHPQEKQGVYYASPSGEVTRLIDDLLFPNGVVISPDEQTLYVLPYNSSHLMAYSIASPGKIGKAKELVEIAKGKRTFPKGGDGLAIDVEGNLYLTAPATSSIQVVSPAGKTLGLIPIPEAPSNCAFGGKDRKTLFVTASKSVYAVPMAAVGYCVLDAGN